MLQPLLSRPIARGGAGAMLAVTLAITPLHAGGTPSSPVRPVASINRSQFSPTEWDVLVNHFDMVIGLTASGYDFPGPIDAFRAANQTTPVLTYVELTAIQGGNIGDDRYDQYDEVEDVFFHTADPASLRVYTVTGGVALTWMRDSRDRSGGTYTAPGVAEYLIETAPSASGPWTEAATFTEIDDIFNTTTLPGASTSAWYRIRSRLADDRIVDYGRPTQPDTTPTVIASGLFVGTTFTAVVHGPDAPTNPADLRLEVDVDGNRFWEPQEYVAASSRQSLGNGYWEYNGTTAVPTIRANYRFRLTNVAGSTTPGNGESYTQIRRNNRLQTKFGAFIIKPAHPLTEAIHIQRLRDALDAGYDGVHLDFAYDDMSPTWITVANVAPHEQAQAANLPTSVRNLIGAIRADRPNALVHFNGYYVAEDPANYYAYLDEATGGAFEFFAFGFQEGATDIHPTSNQSVTNVIETSHVRNKVSVVIAYEAADNVAARLKSLAMYLVIAHDKVRFAYTSTDHQSVDWYPEYRVPLGTPLIQTLNGSNHVHPSSSDVIYRQYTNGRVYFNFSTTTPFVVSLPSTHYRLGVTGGQDPILGGDGEAFYVPVNELTVAPGEGAILVTDPPGGGGFNIGDADGDQCGRAVAPVGDVNGDGVADYAIGLPYNDDAGDDAGRVDICSGATGAVLRSATGDQPGERFGESIAGPGDVNDDGVPDLLVGAPYNDHAAGNAGAAYVIDGANGAQIAVRYGKAQGDRFGHAVAGGMDVDGDGVGDLVIGAPYNDDRGNNAGRVEVLSGATRQRLKILRGDAGDRFGWAVASIGRTKGPGHNDFAVGAPYDDDGGSNAGKVYVHEGDDFGVNFALEGRKAGDQFGRAVAGVGRADGDARDDILVGAPYTKVQGDAKRGRIELFSGHDGDRIWSRTGASAGERLGWSVASAGDVDGDGKVDVIAGAPFHDDDGRGRVEVRRGINGASIATYFGDPIGHRFGWAVAGIAPSGDDGPDVLIADPTDDLAGTNTGRVHHVTLDEAATAAAASPCPADLNGDRVVGALDLLRWLEADGFADDRRGDASSIELSSIIAAWGPC